MIKSNVKKKIISLSKKILLPSLIFISIASVAHADGPVSIDDAKTRIITMIQFAEGIMAAIFITIFAFKAKWSWGMRNITENGADIEKHNKSFQRAILGAIGFAVIGVVFIYITNTFK